ncbi:MAG: DsrE family protein [Lysobacteraceae bacterium]
MAVQKRFPFIAALLLAGLFVWGGLRAADSSASRTVVYHVSDSAQATFALRNVMNHRRADPDIRIVVVANGPGVAFLADGAKDARGNTYDVMVEPLIAAGVKFRVCGNSLAGLQIAEDQLLFDVEVVPAGVQEIARLQIEEHAAYIKP